jgi:hypothetical protein
MLEFGRLREGAPAGAAFAALDAFRDPVPVCFFALAVRADHAHFLILRLFFQDISYFNRKK